MAEVDKPQQQTGSKAGIVRILAVNSKDRTFYCPGMSGALCHQSPTANAGRTFSGGSIANAGSDAIVGNPANGLLR